MRELGRWGGGGDGNAIYLDWGGSHTDVLNCQILPTAQLNRVHFTVCIVQENRFLKLKKKKKVLTYTDRTDINSYLQSIVKHAFRRVTYSMFVVMLLNSKMNLSLLFFFFFLPPLDISMEVLMSNKMLQQQAQQRRERGKKPE